MRKKVILIIFLAMIAISSAFLFYNQAVGNYPGDLFTHISTAISDGMNENKYSITNVIYNFLYTYCGKEYGIAIFLSLVTVANIIITKKVLEYYMDSDKDVLMWIFAFLLNFNVAIFIPWISGKWVVGVQSANPWHNSTYICMKGLGLVSLLLFFKMKETYLEKIELKKYILFALLLSITNAIKPNFIMVFAPAMAIYLLIDFIANIKNIKSIRNIFIFGSAVLISLLVLVYQSIVLFQNSASDGSGIEIGWFTFISYWHKYPLISILQSTLFPLFILLTNFKTIKKDIRYSFVLVMHFVGLMEYCFLNETGLRIHDGNFSWGYSFALFMSFLGALSILDKSRTEERKHKKLYLCVGYGLFAIHTLLGIIYYFRVLTGHPYA